MTSERPPSRRRSRYFPRRSAASIRRSTRLSRDSIVNAALTFLDREGWDALTINALATQLGTKGPSLYNHVTSLEDLRRTVRMRVVGDIIDMLNTVGQGRTRDDAAGDGEVVVISFGGEEAEEGSTVTLEVSGGPVRWV